MMQFGEKYAHQTWGLIRWNRFQGNSRFFGSDLNHNSGISIYLDEAQVERDLSQTWFFGGKHLVKLSMAESQFAEFLTTPNSGSGIPCTIEYRPTGPWEAMGELKDMPSEYDMHREEGKKTIRESMKECAALKENINGLKISAKAKRDLCFQLDLIERKIGSSLDFVEESFQRRMDEIVQKAKTDIEAFNYHSRIANGLQVKEIADDENAD